MEEKAFHGTSFENYINIKEAQFVRSEDDSHWLGDGVYFFVKSYVCPKPNQNAIEWIRAEAYKKGYKIGAVIEADISLENEKYILDLTNNDGIEIFEYIKQIYMSKLRAISMVSKNTIEDGHIINKARIQLQMRFDIVKGHFFIKTEEERIANLSSRIPNSTILSVYNTDLIKIIKAEKIIL